MPKTGLSPSPLLQLVGYLSMDDAEPTLPVSQVQGQYSEGHF